jgi:hypothetical protein
MSSHVITNPTKLNYEQKIGAGLAELKRLGQYVINYAEELSKAFEGVQELQTEQLKSCELQNHQLHKQINTLNNEIELQKMIINEYKENFQKLNEDFVRHKGLLKKEIELLKMAQNNDIDGKKKQKIEDTVALWSQQTEKDIINNNNTNNSVPEHKIETSEQTDSSQNIPNTYLVKIANENRNDLMFIADYQALLNEKKKRENVKAMEELKALEITLPEALRASRKDAALKISKFVRSIRTRRLLRSLRSYFFVHFLVNLQSQFNITLTTS